MVCDILHVGGLEIASWCQCSDNVKVKVKWSRYRPGVAQSVGRGIALLFHDRGTGTGFFKFIYYTACPITQ